jgi:hypothetical protein
MRERGGSVELKDVDFVTMRVFLRMLYTGHVCEEDWADTNPVVKRRVPEESAAPPLDVLLSVLGLAKKYMCYSVASYVMQILKRRMARLSLGDEVVVWETIMAYAIANDVGPLRMAALQRAKHWPEVRGKYDERKLRPEILFELEALWPPPPPPSLPPAKRLKKAV